jgi:hypothetical protein
MTTPPNLSYSHAGAIAYINGVPVECVAQIDQLGYLVTPGGAATVPIPAGTAGNTVVKAAPGRLCRVLVTTSGSGEVLIYDNATEATGTIIGVIPAGAPTGCVFDFEMPAIYGITVGGGPNNPATTVSYY